MVIDDEDTLEIARCLDAPQTKNCVYIDVNNYGPCMIQWLEKTKLGKRTGREAQYREYEQGAPYLIQNVFPELSNGERGLLPRGQGMCNKCFKKMFGSF